MSLLFGNLTNAFVDFGTTTIEAKAGNVTAQNDLPRAASNFKRTAANDASYLVYIGMYRYSRLSLVAHCHNRYRHARMHIRLHADLGVDC